VRILALGGLVGPALFALVTTLCAALRPDYSHIDDFISELGATGTPHAAIMNYAGFVPAGLLLCGLGASLALALPQNRLTAVGASLVTLFGAGVAAAGLLSCDVGCPQAGGSVENLIHDGLAPVSFASASLGAVILGVRFRDLPEFRSLWVYSVASGLAGFCLLGGLASTLESRELTGLWQRLAARRAVRVVRDRRAPSLSQGLCRIFHPLTRRRSGRCGRGPIGVW
jgi:hypothetical membrane protein